MINFTYENIKGNNALKSNSSYNRNLKILARHKRKWKLKESYKQVYRTIGEGFIFLCCVAVIVASIYIWFY